jgi:saccharopine dehydrogenase (NADP+, L-glutamate forming)
MEVKRYTKINSLHLNSGMKNLPESDNFAAAMKTILLLGAGRSSSSLIRYLLENAAEDNYFLQVADLSLELALEKTGGHPAAKAIALNVTDDEARGNAIRNAGLVISLLPPALHILAAKDCLKFGKHLVTASYISPEIAALDAECHAKGLLFLNECGLDPGIDHMSAMQIIHDLQRKGAQLTAFRSYTGGLVAPESNDNPWGYKFTWNPRNVILAGQGTARYIRDGKYYYIPYPRLFSETSKIVIEGTGTFDGYANRDSLAYRKHYGLDTIPTLLRGTLRYENYCAGWQVFVSLGITDDTFIVENSHQLTYAEFIGAFIPSSVTGKNTEERLKNYLGTHSDLLYPMIASTGLLEDEKTGLENATPAQILLHRLQQKWVLGKNDLDMVVMQHQFEYSLNGKREKIISSLVVKGESQLHTAMAKTVGLPLGIAARLILKEKVKLTGVYLPVQEEIYTPVLKELETINIRFTEQHSVLS